VQIFEPVFEIRLVVSPSLPVHSGSGILLEFEERLPEQLDSDMVEERGELLLLPVPCHLPYAVQRLPGPGPGTCFADPYSPWPPPFAPPTPQRIAPLCSSASQPIWRSLTSRTATGHAWDLPVPGQRASAHASFFDDTGPSGRSR